MIMVGFRVGDLFDMRKKHGIGRLGLQSSIVKGVVSGAASRGPFEDMGPVQLEDFMNMRAFPVRCSLSDLFFSRM